MSLILGSVSTALLLFVLIVLVFVKETQEQTITRGIAFTGLVFGACLLIYSHLFDQSYLSLTLACLASVVGFLFDHWEKNFVVKTINQR